MTTKTPADVRKMLPAAEAFVKACRKAGWQISVTPAFADPGRSNVVSITKKFAPNDNAAYVACDCEYYGLLSMLKARGGSMWGTDGSGVGGHFALVSGCFTMKVSGVSDAMAKALYAALGDRFNV
jgi:hypothetical protein